VTQVVLLLDPGNDFYHGAVRSFYGYGAASFRRDLFSDFNNKRFVVRIRHVKCCWLFWLVDSVFQIGSLYCERPLSKMAVSYRAIRPLIPADGLS
jgi:hypothetical protein